MTTKKAFLSGFVLGFFTMFIALLVIGSTYPSEESEKISQLQEWLSGNLTVITELRSQVNTLQGQINQKDKQIIGLQSQVEELELQLHPPPPSPGEIGSRSNPAPIGTSLISEYDYDEYTFIVKVTILEITRGSEAWDILYETHSYNDPPPEGYEYILVKMRFECVEGPDAPLRLLPSYLGGPSFPAFSSGGAEYDEPYMHSPFPEMTGWERKVYPGGKLEGWHTFQVRKDDYKPVMTVGLWERNWKTWFKLYEES